MEHEFGHYIDDVKNHKIHDDRQKQSDPQYTNKEEKRVIEMIETFTAKKNGEGVRYNHAGKTYNTSSSVSIR